MPAPLTRTLRWISSGIIGLTACQAPLATTPAPAGIAPAEAPATQPRSPLLPGDAPIQPKPATTAATPVQLTNPQPGTAAPADMTAPPQGLTAPPQGLTAPPQGITAPPQGITAPPQGFTLLQARLEPEGYSTQAETGRYYLKLNQEQLNQSFTPTADGAQELSGVIPSNLLTAGDFTVEVGRSGGSARSYHFELPTGPIVRLELKLFPDSERRGELGIQTRLDVAATVQLSLNLPGLLPALLSPISCLSGTQALSQLKMTPTDDGQQLTWQGAATSYVVRVDGTLLGETSGHSFGLHLTGAHQISVEPRISGCLLTPIAIASEAAGTEAAGGLTAGLGLGLGI